MLGLAIREGFELFVRNFPALLIIGLILVVSHVQRLIVPPRQFLLRLEFVLDRLVHPCAAGCALNIDRIQVPHIGLILRNPILKGIPLRRLQYACGGDFRVIEASIEVLASAVDEVLLASGYLRGEILGLAVVPSAIRQVVLFVEGTGLVIAELVVPHNKFINRNPML